MEKFKGFDCYITINMFDQREIEQMFGDGRFASHIVERYLPKLFKFLERRNSKNWDFINILDGTKYECKCFTTKGLKAYPSSMVGKGRNVDYQEFFEIAKELEYIFVDITHYPTFDVTFISGEELLEISPNGRFGKRNKNLIF